MRIGIIGGGSIGLLVSSLLSLKHKNKFKITIYVRRYEQKQSINQNGLVLNQSEKTQVRSMLINDLEKEDYLFICVKQTHIESLLPFLKRKVDGAPLIFLQNGMGHIEFIQSLHNPIFVGVVEHGALRISDHEVLHTGRGLIRLATYKGDSEQLEYLINKLHHPNFPIQSSTHWNHLLAEKLVVNAVINPLTTLFGVKNIQIITNQYINQLAKKLCQEAARTLNLDVKNQWEKVVKIARSTGNNTSSMLSDLRNKQKTEIEAISGFLLKNSKENIPYTFFAYKSIQAMEEKNGIT